MTAAPPLGNWTFYIVGILLIALGITFVLVPFLGGSTLSKMKIPWILLYIYNKNGFYFATSPILIIISLIMLIAFFIRR